MNTQSVTPTATTTTFTGTRCFFGIVFVVPTTTVGATNGFLLTQNTLLRIRQVPGPGNQGTPLANLNQQLAIVCGNFVRDTSGLVLNVTLAFGLGNLGGLGLGGLGSGTGLGTGLGGLGGLGTGTGLGTGLGGLGKGFGGI